MMNNKNILRISSVLIFWCLACSADEMIGAEKGHGTSAKSTKKIAGSPSSSLININNIAMWAQDNGSTERRPQDGNAGTYFPRGTSTVIYAGGLVWGGLVKDGASPELRVGGQTYNYGTVPGRIVSRGVAESPSGPSVRIFRVRRDWASADLSRDAAEFNDKPLSAVTAGDIGQLRAQYKKDWLEWPWQKGAPYYDRDNNGTYDPDPTATYDPTKDEPGLGGADQVMWFVCNDLDASKARGLYGSPPVGIEMQFTGWAYARTDELGNVIFQRYRIIYKGTATTPANATIDSMFLAKWSDPDLGDYGDDYAGSVRDLSLGFVYNSTPVDAEFKKFDLVPPVAGYDFFQGPRVASPGDQARWDLKRIDGYKNLPMTTFAFFAAGGRDSDPTLSNYEGTKQWYNLLRGYRPRPTDPAECFVDPTINQCTQYELDGDPATLRGWIDGRREPASDRRIVLSSGPFSMALGDTQEVVVGLIGALGKDYIDGIDVLKNIDRVAQDAFNLSFELPVRVPEVSLRVIELDKKLILDWESDTSQLRKIETYSSKGYQFETYTIYQYPGAGATIDQAKILPPFDVTSPRSLQITTDKIRNKPLVNGQRYYYAVTATVYNPDPALAKQRLESSVSVKITIPSSPDPGIVYPYKIDDVVKEITNRVGVNDAVITPKYFDPTRPDAHRYVISFRKASPQAKPTWSLTDLGTEASPLSDTLIKGIKVDTAEQRVITRGYTIEVKSSPLGTKGAFHKAQEKSSVFNTPDPTGSYMIVGKSATSIASIGGGNTNDRDLEWRFGDSSWAMIRGNNVRGSRWIRVPYTMWQVGRSPEDTDERKVYTVITDQSQDTLWRPSDILGRMYAGKTLQTFYPVTVVVDSIGSVPLNYRDDIPFRTESSLIKGFLFNNSDSTAYRSIFVALFKVFIGDLDGDGNPPPSGTVVRLEKYKAIQDGDENLFLPQSVRKTDLGAVKNEIEKINVFPNPYYGVNRSELSRFTRFVTFNHLPAYAKIRIFNLAGTLVRTLEKRYAPEPGRSDQFVTWDLDNENGLPIASGIYIAHLELKDVNGIDLGTKTLKLMIVQEQQFLESY